MSNGVKVSFNSPAILSFVALCAVVLLASLLTNGATNRSFFSVYRSSFASPTTYVRLFGHVVGHQNYAHFFGNITTILLIGPLLEEKYGAMCMVGIILLTALVTGILHMMLFPNTALLGASGVVFAFIILSSITSMSEGEIPLTFILIVVIYVGKEIYSGVFVRDNISNFTHIIGGFVGAFCGYLLNVQK